MRCGGATRLAWWRLRKRTQATVLTRALLMPRPRAVVEAQNALTQRVLAQCYTRDRFRCAARRALARRRRN